VPLPERSITRPTLDAWVADGGGVDHQLPATRVLPVFPLGAQLMFSVGCIGAAWRRLVCPRADRPRKEVAHLGQRKVMHLPFPVGDLARDFINAALVAKSDEETVAAHLVQRGKRAARGGPGAEDHRRSHAAHADLAQG
jgi:hypothetical protein